MAATTAAATAEAESESEARFLCTFCWRPQYAPAKPKVLGRSARISCEGCWRGVLDLSICWVCGEVVGRGEEVVSLGWCFWHRGCFGCLLCGTGLEAPALLNVGDGVRLGARGVELECVPLCAWCENVAAWMPGPEVLENGLVNVTKSDGGLSRARLGLWTGLEDVGVVAEILRAPGALTTVQTEGGTCVDVPIMNVTAAAANDQKTVVLGQTPDVIIGEDGNSDVLSGRTSPVPDASAVQASTIYVSVLDAVGEPAFRPSKTKPLPKWMSLLPRNRQRAPPLERHVTTKDSQPTVGLGLTSMEDNELQELESAPGLPTPVHRRSSPPVVAAVPPEKPDEVRRAVSVVDTASEHSKTLLHRPHTPYPHPSGPHQSSHYGRQPYRHRAADFRATTNLALHPEEPNQSRLSSPVVRPSLAEIEKHQWFSQPVNPAGPLIPSGAIPPFPTCSTDAMDQVHFPPKTPETGLKRLASEKADLDGESLRQQKRSRMGLTCEGRAAEDMGPKGETDGKDALRRELMGLFHQRRGDSHSGCG